MGMFDNFVALEEDAKKFTCQSGFVPQLQTKDFDCSLSTIYMFNGTLYERTRTSFGREDKVETLVDGDELEMTTVSKSRCRRLCSTGTAVAYGHDDGVKPVLTLNESASWGRINEHHPFYEWEISYVNGRVTNVKELKAETREEIAKTLSKSGLIVVPDTDAVAIAHFRALARKREKEVALDDDDI